MTKKDTASELEKLRAELAVLKDSLTDAWASGPKGCSFLVL